jgi:hypothetical protein
MNKTNKLKTGCYWKDCWPEQIRRVELACQLISDHNNCETSLVMLRDWRDAYLASLQNAMRKAGYARGYVPVSPRFPVTATQQHYQTDNNLASGNNVHKGRTPYHLASKTKL